MRLRTILLLGLPAALLAGHAALWTWAAGRLSTGLDDWVAERRVAGWSVEHGGAARGGWPLAATLTVSRAAVSPVAGLSWRAQRIVLRVALVRPGVLSIAPDGAQTLLLGSAPPIDLEAGAFSVDAPLSGARPTELTARDLRATADGETAAVGLLTGSVSPADRTAGFALAAEAVTLPEDMRWALGPHISSVSAEGALTGLGAEPEGAALDVRRFAIGWGPLGASGSGRLDLDAARQPRGAASVRLVGAAAALDAASSSGLIASSAATAAKAVLALLQRASDSGGRIDVPVALRDGSLSAAGIPLARLPPIAWPAAAAAAPAK